MGARTQYILVSARGGGGGTCHVGGAIAQVRLLVARVPEECSSVWSWGTYPPPPYHPRPMSNLLTPPGLIKSTSYCCLTLDSPQATSDPMPCFPGAWIITEHGHRRLLLDECARGLGIPKDWRLDPRKLNGNTLLRTTSVFHWEFLSTSFLPTVSTSYQAGSSSPSATIVPSSLTDMSPPPFSWRPPSLGQSALPGGRIEWLMPKLHPCSFRTQRPSSITVW